MFSTTKAGEDIIKLVISPYNEKGLNCN